METLVSVSRVNAGLESKPSMKENQFLIGAAQWDVQLGDPEKNFMYLERFAREAAAAGVKLLVLPELWPISFDIKNPRASAWTQRSLDRASALSRELGLILVGSALDFSNGRVFNRSVLFDSGDEKGSYRKVHLFSPTGEPKAFAHGDSAPPVIDTAIGRVGLVICYDIRFPETIRKLYEQEVDIITVPAQWASARIEHWKALLIARAIENQSYVIGANRCGMETQGGRDIRFPGSSMVIDSWGEILGCAEAGPGWISAEFSRARLDQVRREVPARRDCRKL